MGKKAVAVVAVATALVVATAVTVATCGAGSVAGVAMITTTATLAARTTEVVALQVEKGKQEGKNGRQIAKDSMESIYDNSVPIAGITPYTKPVGVATIHGLNTLVEESFGGKQTLGRTLQGPGGKFFPYALAAMAWAKTAISVIKKDPVARANERGYTLK